MLRLGTTNPQQGCNRNIFTDEQQSGSKPGFLFSAEGILTDRWLFSKFGLKYTGRTFAPNTQNQ